VLKTQICVTRPQCVNKYSSVQHVIFNPIFVYFTIKI